MDLASHAAPVACTEPCVGDHHGEGRRGRGPGRTEALDLAALTVGHVLGAHVTALPRHGIPVPAHDVALAVDDHAQRVHHDEHQELGATERTECRPLATRFGPPVAAELAATRRTGCADPTDGHDARS